MRYRDLLKLSWYRYAENKSLLSVLLLEFIARTIAIAAFIAIDIAIVMAINDVAFLPSGIPDINSFLNAKTYIVAALLLLVEFAVILYISSFFLAGFSGMLRNVVQDGGTTFEEFLPNAKRYWYPSFRYLSVPYAVLAVSLLPFIYFYGVAGMVAASGGVFSSQILLYLGASLALALLAMAGVLFFLSYGPAVIVFDDADAWDAMRDSITLARRKARTTLLMTATIMGIIILASLLYFGINLCFALLIEMLRQEWMVTAAKILELLLQVITISAAVIAGIFAFLTYDQITTEKAARKMETKAPVTRIRKRA